MLYWLKMDKKGFSNIFFVFLIALAFIFYIAPIYLKLNSEPIKPQGIGADAIKLINSYDVVEDFKIYLEKSAELSSCQAFYDHTKNGGYFENKCGKENGYNKWDVNCNPFNNLESDYKKYFDREFKQYFQTTASYIYSFDDGNFIGATESKVEKSFDGIRYFVSPTFRIKPDFDLKIYSEINNKIEENINCFSDTEKSPDLCIKEDNWNMERKGKLIFFDIKTDTKCIIKDGNEFKEDNANIKFIRDFTKKDLLATENLLG